MHWIIAIRQVYVVIYWKFKLYFTYCVHYYFLLHKFIFFARNSLYERMPYCCICVQNFYYYCYELHLDITIYVPPTFFTLILISSALFWNDTLIIIINTKVCMLRYHALTTQPINMQLCLLYIPNECDPNQGVKLVLIKLTIV